MIKERFISIVLKILKSMEVLRLFFVEIDSSSLNFERCKSMARKEEIKASICWSAFKICKSAIRIS